jgi:3-dehydroquinate synthase
VENCCRIKKSIVEIDEKEQGLRRLLNFGHTLGHAIEAESQFTISHGEGVALGMIAAARISEKMNYLDALQLKRIEEIILRAGLPVKIPRDFSVDGIISRVAMDKKKRDDVVHFVLLRKIGMPFVNGGIENKLLGDVIEGMK